MPLITLWIVAPATWVLIIPIIILEAWIAVRWLKLKWGKAFLISIAANIASTLVGIPFTYVVIGGAAYALFGATAGIPLLGDITMWMLQPFVFFPFWKTWVLPLALIGLLIPSFFVTYWIEKFVARGLLRAKSDAKEVAKRWSLYANAASYALMAILLSMWFAFELISSFELEEKAEEKVEELRLERRKASLLARANQGDREAILLLAREFRDPSGLKELAELGDIEAARELVILTGQSTKVLQNAAEDGELTAAILLARHANELAPLRLLAESGDYKAAHMLGMELKDDAYLESVAPRINSIVAYELYERLSSERKITPSQFLTAWRWLCLSANAGYSKAQAKVGFWHRSSSWENWKGWNEEELDLLRKAGVQSNNRISYMWYTLAASTGDESAKRAREETVAVLLTDAEIDQAEEMARGWSPGDCPSKEHQLGPPGEM